MKKRVAIFFIFLLLMLGGCTSTEKGGFFKTGQEADLMVSGFGFDDSGGPLVFNHNGGIATDGTHLILADRTNNRILIWNTLPENGDQEPDLVLGQKDFIGNNPGDGMDELSWPIAVATDGTHVVVADTNNDRVLIWNMFPTENGQPADMVIDDLKRAEIIWPWAVWTNGEKLIVTDSTGGVRPGKILIWNTFPTGDNQDPDVVLANSEFGTPRSIASDGTHLVIGDHNAYGSASAGVNVTALGGAGNFFWSTFPTEDNQSFDFFMNTVGKTNQKTWFYGPTMTDDGKLLALTDNGLYIWNNFPVNENDAPDVSVGTSGGFNAYFGNLNTGDGSGIAVAGEKVFISLSNGNRVVVYNSFPTETEDMPDFALGSPDINTNTLLTNAIITNPVLATDGESLFASSDYDKRLYVWKELPEESGTLPDFALTFPVDFSPLDNALYDDTLVVAGHKTVVVYNLPLSEGTEPDLVFEDRIGDVEFGDITGVALDENYFYLADKQANAIYVWKGVPEENENPLFTITTDAKNPPGRLQSDGTYLLTMVPLQGPIYNSISLYYVDELSAASTPVYIQKLQTPEGALTFDGHFAVSETGTHRVDIWKSVDDAVAGKSPDAVLGNQESAQTVTGRPRSSFSFGRIGKDTFYLPYSLAYDGEHLWISEVKFSYRILRFSPE